MFLKRLLCRHHYPKGCAQIIFIGSEFDKDKRPMYLYQNFCSKCGKRVQMLSDDETLREWMEENEKEVDI